MSEDKKASWGKACDTNAPRETAAGAPGQPDKVSAAPVQAAAGGSEKASASADRASRARSQHVLPGILGKQLRAAYGELLNSPVPDAITELIKKLEAKEAASPAAGAAQPRDEESGQ